MMSNKNLKSDKGFTLIEVIVVLVIIAILMSIAIPSILGYIEKTKKTACEANRLTLYKDLCMSLVSNEPLTQEYANKILSEAEPVCPSGGTVSITINNNEITIICDKHGKTSTKGDIESTVCKTFLEQYQAYIDTMTNKNNSKARQEFFDKNGGFPTMSVDVNGSVNTYQIEPFYNSSTGEYWLFAKQGDGTSINASNFYADMVYDPDSGKWYQHLHSYSHKPDKTSMTFKSIAELQEKVKDSNSWLEVHPSYN